MWEIMAGGVLGILTAIVGALPELTITWPDLSAVTSLMWMVNDVLPVDLVFELVVLVLEAVVVIYGFRLLMWALSKLPFFGGGG